MTPLVFLEIVLPLTNPVLKFLLILIIILFAPIILNKIKIPHLLGLIIAGAVIGPYGFNLLERDESIILSGTAGLLYIMFLAGLEIDLLEFKKNSQKSIVFGLYTFAIPMILGTLTGLYILKISMYSSVLLASMFASHTLIAYPLISKLGVAKNKAVTVTVGGTMITDTLALLVLAVIVGMTTGEVNGTFWLRLTISVIVFGIIVLLVFPIFGRWFFKRYEDNVSQYIFVLVMVFLGAFLAELAGIEAMIGAFLSGLALNRLIPHTSALMNRIEFVGNAIFIPFFLIGVGMLVDYRAFFKNLDSIIVAIVMIVVATSAKFIAAWLTQKTYRFSVDERRLIFGLSNAQAAATLAAVLVGYNIILDTDANGEPIRLLDESILNGTILMILVTCTIASFVAQKGAKNIALLEANETPNDDTENAERILIPIKPSEHPEELINLAIIIKSKNNRNGLYALSIVDTNSTDGAIDKKAKKALNTATIAAAATDDFVTELLRYDSNSVNGIKSVVKEHKISDLIIGVDPKKDMSELYFENLNKGILAKCNTTTLLYKSIQPLATVRRHIVVVPDKAEKEIGFPFWLIKVWNIARNSRTKLVFYASTETLKFIREVHFNFPVECDFIEFNDWYDFLILSKDFQKNDNLIFVLSRKEKISYQNNMSKMPTYLNNFFKEYSVILIYPIQSGVGDLAKIDLKNPTIADPIEKLDELRKTITQIFKRK